MVWMRLLGGLTFLAVALVTVGALLSMANSFVGDVAPMAVVGLVLAVVLVLGGYGSSFDHGSPYW